MTFLITGATGFVGRRVAEILLAEGEGVRALVRTPAKAQDLAGKGAEIVAGDLVDGESVRRAVAGTDVVLHCGAAIGPHLTGRQQFETNAGGVRNVFEAVRREGRGRVVSVSSAMVLGTRDLRPATDETPPRVANDPGADSKIEAERIARGYMEDGVSAVIIRPPLVYGPGDPYNIPKFAAVLQEETFRFVGSRGNVVPIVHVDDIARPLQADEGAALLRPAAGLRLVRAAAESRRHHAADRSGRPPVLRHPPRVRHHRSPSRPRVRTGRRLRRGRRGEHHLVPGTPANTMNRRTPRRRTRYPASSGSPAERL